MEWAEWQEDWNLGAEKGINDRLESNYYFHDDSYTRLPRPCLWRLREKWGANLASSKSCLVLMSSLIVSYIIFRMAGMGDLEETIVTSRKAAEENIAALQEGEERYTVLYKTTSMDALAGPFFRAVLATICTQLYNTNGEGGGASQGGNTVEIRCSPTPSHTPTQLHFVYNIKLGQGKCYSWVIEM